MSVSVSLNLTQLAIMRAIVLLQQQHASNGLTIQEIADFAEISYSSARLHLKRLEKAGCISREIAEKPGRPYKFEVHVDVQQYALFAPAVA